jgi:ribosomal protein S3AE
MTYYKADAGIMEALQKEIEQLGMPLVLMRKFNQLIGAITVQIEDEYVCYRVVETVFTALNQQAEEIRQPEGDFILEKVAECHQKIIQLLQKRKDQALI